MSAVSALSRAELEARLEEAEETLRAIRDGEIDAVVVRAADEEQVFTLEGGGQSYRTFMETMDVGAAAFDQDGQLLYANQALCALLDCAHGSLTASALIALLDPANQAAFRRLLAQAQRERQSAEIHLRVGEIGRAHV